MSIWTRRNVGLLVPSYGRRILASIGDRTRWSSSDSSQGPERNIVKSLLGLMSGALATCGTILYLIDRSVRASDLQAKPPRYPWPTNRPISSIDHASARRGWHVYRNVCATCHSLQFLHFRDLVDVTHTEKEMKEIAAEYEIQDGPDEEGNYYMRPCKLPDPIPMPFPNEEAARAANNGAYPADLCFVVNGRKRGKDYIFSLLTGYREAPVGFQLGDGQSFNIYFPGGALSMPEMIQDGIVEYDDGTPATSSQIAKDVVEFLTWTSEQKWDERKVVCMKGIGICAILLAIVAHMNRQRWAVMKTRKIAYVPKRKC